MKKILLTLLTFITCLSFYSQQSKIDSLENSFKKIKTDSILFKTLGVTAVKYRNRNANLHYYIIQKAIRKAESENNRKEEANFKRELGIYYRKKGDLDSAIYSYEKAKTIYTNLKDSLNINIVNSSLANVYKTKGDYEKAIESFKNIINFFDKKEVNSQMRKLITEFNLAGVYINMKDWKTADDLLSQIYNDSLAKKNKGLLKATAINLVATKQKINELDKALSFGKIAEELTTDTRGSADLFTNIGSIYEIQQQYKKAQQYFLKALEKYKTLNSKSGIVLSYNNLGNNAIVLGDYKNAEKYLLQSKELLKEDQNLKSISHNQKMLASLYEKKGDYKKSLEYLKQDIVLTDSILGIEKQKAIANLEVKFETEKVKKDKDIIEKKATILALENEKNKSFFLASLLIIILILISGIFYSSRLKAKRQAALTALELKETKKRLTLERQYKNSELRALKAQMNPHFIFNAMNSIQSLILKGNKHEAYTYLTKFASLLRENLNISEKSFVDIEEELSLLRKYLELEKLRFHKDFEYEIIEENNIDDVKIPSMIIQPFVENAIKHGLIHKTDGTKKLTIKFHLKDVFTCTIIDNGIGIEASKEINKNNGKKESFSTRSIKEKLQFLEEYYKMNIGFSYENIESGTKVIIKIPYKK